MIIIIHPRSFTTPSCKSKGKAVQRLQSPAPRVYQPPHNRIRHGSLFLLHHYNAAAASVPREEQRNSIRVALFVRISASATTRRSTHEFRMYDPAEGGGGGQAG